jgi:hypothetical protein
MGFCPFHVIGGNGPRPVFQIKFIPSCKTQLLTARRADIEPIN